MCVWLLGRAVRGRGIGDTVTLTAAGGASHNTSHSHVSGGAEIGGATVLACGAFGFLQITHPADKCQARAVQHIA